MNTTATKPAFMTISAYEEARDLPEAIRLNRDFIRHEREFCRTYALDFPEDAECGAGLDAFEATLAAAYGIWSEELIIARQRIAQRIRAEVPNQENYGDIAGCVESGDYSEMAA